ncbi:hypothetical protein DPMN_108864 [Dreissena polymorpha]|uniref:Fibronectin type-III domain-containing protein n=1 Tax=Dreissena polymorpha TaxID=45954 RepID=A0A9D4KA04_DREPO|nr:hypothetical protein DPMN_108864 [Dreissena polymorpha]
MINPFSVMIVFCFIIIIFSISVTGESPGRIKPLRPQINNPDSLGARITGLEPNHDYRFYVWARTNTGRGEGAHTDVTTKDGDRKL